MKRRFSSYESAAICERETVDLPFFPTGGGKTEAHLGLAAFTMVLRRLRYPGIRSAAPRAFCTSSFARF
jgi:hypothetical protein